MQHQCTKPEPQTNFDIFVYSYFQQWCHLLVRVCFQDFLRSVPGSLLCCELHEEWMDVLEEEEEEEEQVQDIQR